MLHFCRPWPPVAAAEGGYRPGDDFSPFPDNEMMALYPSVSFYFIVSATEMPSKTMSLLIFFIIIYRSNYARNKIQKDLVKNCIFLAWKNLTGNAPAILVVFLLYFVIFAGHLRVKVPLVKPRRTEKLYFSEPLFGHYPLTIFSSDCLIYGTTVSFASVVV